MFLKYKIKQTPNKTATIRTTNNSDNFHVLTVHGFPFEFSMQSSNIPHDSHETATKKKEMPRSIFFFGMIIKTNIKLLTYMILPKIRVLDQSCMHPKLSMCSFPGQKSGDL